MATTTSDRRVVRVNLSAAELATLLGQRAQAAGIIDFAPDSVTLDRREVDGEDGWEAVFATSL